MARTCGNVGCSERDKTQEQCNAGKCERIGCASVKEKTGEEPGDRQRRCNPDDNPDKRRASPFAYDQEQNIAALCTDCHANPDFLCTTRDKICDRAVEAHCHKHETGDGKRCHEEKKEATIGKPTRPSPLRMSRSEPGHPEQSCGKSRARRKLSQLRVTTSGRISNGECQGASGSRRRQTQADHSRLLTSSV